MRYTEVVTELYDPESSFKLEWDDTFGPAERHARAHDRQGNYIDINFVPVKDDIIEVEFSRNDSYDMTGGGDANRVLGTVLEAFREYLRGYQPKMFVFSAKGGSRSRVYQSLIKRFAATVGYRQFDMSKLSPEKRAKIVASGSDLMVLRKAAVSEAFDNPYKGKWEKSDYGDIDVNAKLPDGTYLNIMFNQEYDGEGEEVVQVEFHRNNSQEVTGEGDAQRIFATVLDAIQKYIKKYKPQRLSFSASKSVDMDADDVERFNPESRAKLYTRLVQRYAGAWGYQSQHSDEGDVVIYQLTRAMAENFHDGRNPQDKGDAKRHGINTKASVSSLRKTAKQGGRKGQLAHWLANMKAGRAKAKRK